MPNKTLKILWKTIKVASTKKATKRKILTRKAAGRKAEGPRPYTFLGRVHLGCQRFANGSNPLREGENHGAEKVMI